MKTLCWNARGLGNPRGIRNLCDLVKWEGPDVLFLQETRLSVHNMEKCKYKIGFSNCFAVSAIGRKGGIALMWGRDVDLTILNYSDFHVHATILDSMVNGGKWFVTAVYGYPETHLRYKTWDLLRSLCRSTRESWLVMGDLNEILFHHEKMGAWCNSFPNARVSPGVVTYSDHLPIWVELEGEHNGGRSTTQSTMVDVVGMIRECGLKLDAWNMTTFGHVQKKLQQAKQQLNQLYKGDCGSDVSVLNKAREEDDRGQWQEGSSKEKVILDYFRDLFTSANPNASLDFMTVLQGKVTFQMNEALCREYTKVEVKDALQQMHPSKVSGPDGMSPIFFQKYWHVVGRSVTAVVLHALNSGSFPSTLNHTFITLIPKKKTPIRVADYRPISLCNVVYKLVAKVLANRLKMVLNDIIGETQSAFVPGHLITDNVLIAYEIMHFLS
ncbi:hypothetical protein Patl1_15890 [Pistacia atlantica]|uniref:Uncharacterized protein n=1 Tax=Pistacia atlantica TaxID=434234 RepID=A0ACC1B8B9_9ROSI|nr:hypothetical protein Patl1_15890 [Pistacia atlantica]